MIDAKTIEELRGLLAVDTSTDWQTVRSDPAEGADVWWICAKNAAGQEVELGSLQGGRPHPTREARARLIVAMRNALPDLLDAAERLERQVRAKQQEIEEIAARAQENYERALAAERLASRAREEALREAIEICKEADAQDDRDNGAAATGAACNAANAILSPKAEPNQ